MAITSRIVSTTHIVLPLREPLAQILQISLSDMLWHLLQKCISSLIFEIAALKLFTSVTSFFIRCNTKRRAVFFPIPGNRANSFTAFSKRDEEKIIWQR